MRSDFFFVSFVKMRWIILMVSTLAVVNSRPQGAENEQDTVTKVENPDKITFLPFYGGGNGQSLQIVETSDGQITTTIIKTPPVIASEETQENIVDVTELENPPLPSKFETEDFLDNIKKIQSTAASLIRLQEIAKRKGSLTNSEEALYEEEMAILSQTAMNLANMQEESQPSIVENREGLSAWFEKKTAANKKKEVEDKKKKEAEKKRKEEEMKRQEAEEKKKLEEEERRKLEEEKKRKEEENRRKGEEQEEEESGGQGDDDNDSVGIDLPDEDASVAEAKPVGLAIAGEGGVAASRPIATAVVGRGGLAIARPVGTAIAGVDPNDPSYPSYVENYVHGGKTKSSSNKSESAKEYLNRLINKYHQN